MELHTIGIDLGKTVSHLVGLNLRGEVVVRKEVLAHTAAALHCQRTRRVDWHGSLRRCAFSWPSTAGTETRGAADSGAVCEALREDEQERLHRCRGDRRGCLTTLDALRADQDR